MFCNFKFNRSTVRSISLQCFTIIIFTTFCTACYGQLFSANENYRDRRIITSVPFLLITPDARTSSMGDAGVATPSDVNSTGTNASKLSFLPENSGVSVSYIPWLSNLIKGINISQVSAYHRLSENYVIGTSLKYFARERVYLINDNQQDVGELSPNEFALDVSVARKFGSDLSIGATIRHINSNLYSVPSSGVLQMQRGKTVAMDVSAMNEKKIQLFNYDALFAFGINVSNIGPKINYDNSNSLKYFLPTNFKLGTSVTFLGNEDHLTLAFDINKLLVPSPKASDYSQNAYDIEQSVASGIINSFSDANGGLGEEFKEVSFCTGIEYSFLNRFMLRTGFAYQHPEKGDNNYVTVGGGFRLNKLLIDFSYLTASRNRLALSNTLRFTLSLNLGKVKQDLM